MLDALTKLINTTVTAVVGSIESGSYLTIGILMAIESSFIPLPSEVVMIPGGYLAYKGTLNLWGVIFAGTVGSLTGALFNYYMALYVGRPFIHKYGRYFFISPHHLDRVDETFGKYGDIMTFIGRLLPGFRHLISIPAGFTRMPLKRFMGYTTAGASIWCVILTLFGYWIGSKQMVWEEAWHKYSKEILGTSLIIVALSLVTYFGIKYFSKKNQSEPVPPVL